MKVELICTVLPNMNYSLFQNKHTPSDIARRLNHADMESLLKKSPEELKHRTVV
jgi:hypothetical protein